MAESKLESLEEDTQVMGLDSGASSVKAPPALYVMSRGRYFGRPYVLDQPIVYVGRAEMCKLKFNDRKISRYHAMFTVEGSGQVRLEDAGSANGTILNSRRLGYREAVYLSNGDNIRCGKICLKFVAKGELEHKFLDHLWQKATIDALTQMFNRRHLMIELELEFKRSQRYSRDLSLVLFDIDHFKQVNDQYGHPVGDQVLKRIALTIRDDVRASDIPARLGGEEFAMLLPETSVSLAYQIADRIRVKVQNQRYISEGQRFQVTLSSGIAELTNEYHKPLDFLKSCDRLLYLAKRSGRNRTCQSPQDNDCTVD